MEAAEEADPALENPAAHMRAADDLRPRIVGSALALDARISGLERTYEAVRAVQAGGIATEFILELREDPLSHLHTTAGLYSMELLRQQAAEPDLDPKMLVRVAQGMAVGRAADAVTRFLGAEQEIMEAFLVCQAAPRVL